MDLQRLKNLAGLTESASPNAVTPEVKYRQSGDGSWTVRVDYGNDRVYVHTNKKRDALEKIVKDRYGPRTFSS